MTLKLTFMFKTHINLGQKYIWSVALGKLYNLVDFGLKILVRIDLFKLRKVP